MTRLHDAKFSEQPLADAPAPPSIFGTAAVWNGADFSLFNTATCYM